MPRIRPILMSAAAAAPVATLLLAINSSGDLPLWNLVLSYLGVLLLAFMCCLVVAVLVGLPVATLLDKLGQRSRTAFISAGIGVSLVFLSIGLAVDWCCVNSGPFSSPLIERVEMLGLKPVLTQYLRGAGFLIACFTVGANFYWIGTVRRAA